MDRLLLLKIIINLGASRLCPLVHLSTASVRVNQYEQAVHMPDYATAVSLAAVLGVPTAYLYSDDDLIAELLLSAGGLGTKARKALIAQLQSDREP